MGAVPSYEKQLHLQAVRLIAPDTHPEAALEQL